MNYVCKKPFSYLRGVKGGAPLVIEVDVGSILTVIEANTSGWFCFRTEYGDEILLTLDRIKSNLEPIPSSGDRAQRIVCALLNRLSKIEYEIAELRIEMEEIMRESE